MKRLLLFLIMLVPILGLAQLNVNFKAGYNLSKLDSDPEALESTARFGWHVGADFRFGERGLFVPGVMFYRIATDLKTKDEIEGINLETELKMNAFRIPANLGFMILDEDEFKFFVHAGPSFWIPVTVTEDDTGIEIDDIRPFWIGGNAVAGIQIWKITLDVCVDVGITPVNEHVDDSINRTASFSIGYEF